MNIHFRKVLKSCFRIVTSRSRQGKMQSRRAGEEGSVQLAKAKPPSRYVLVSVTVIILAGCQLVG